MQLMESSLIKQGVGVYLLEYCFLPDDSTKLSAVSKRNTVRSLDLSKDSSATTTSTDSKVIMLCLIFL